MVNVIRVMGGAVKPLIMNNGDSIIGAAFCFDDNKLIFMNCCPFCGADLYVPPGYE
jgi:hypothetical protein